MAKTVGSQKWLALDERWVARVLEGIEVDEVPRKLLARLGDRRLCLMVVSGDGTEDAWARYSKAASRRASATGHRLRSLAASGRLDDRFFVAYDIGEAKPLYPGGDPVEISTAQCVQLLHGIERGLDQAAAAGYHPAELSPDSIFVDPGRGAVLADLGVARAALGNPRRHLDVRAPWVAPEVLSGQEPVERSAVYSFGAIMYTLLTGARPYEDAHQAIAAAEPPSLLARRPDLPEPMEIVVSTALARDPRRRYRTVSEIRSLANILLQGELDAGAPPVRPSPGSGAVAAELPGRRRERPQAVPLRRRSAEAASSPKRRRPRSARSEAPAGVALDLGDNGGAAAIPAPQASPTKSPRRARPRRARISPALGALALVLGACALVLGVLAGFLFAGGGSDEPQPPRTVSREDLQLRVPADWRAGPAAAGTLAAHPAGDAGSGLTLEVVDAPVERGEQGNPVRLGELEAWREPQADVVGTRSAVRYVFPTESGKVVATCRASQRAASGTLPVCERALSTLRLRSATGLPIAEVVEQQERWHDEVARLARERAGARRKLARAELPAGQRVAAEALSRVHDRAAGRFAALPGGEAVARAARRTGAAYRRLALVANGESARRWRAALARVRRSEALLRGALADAG